TKLKQIRTNNVFINAGKKFKEIFTSNWNELIKNIKYTNTDLYSKIEDSEVEIVSDTIAILSLSTETASYLFNTNLKLIENEYNKQFNEDYKIICLEKSECTKAKSDYIKNKDKKYIYMSENLDTDNADNDNDTKKNNTSAVEIFGQDLIEIK
ncbi:MAG: hypothetical protein Q4C33_02735, partial [bacterium]|nr:hypothetical protein [bacterium]